MRGDMNSLELTAFSQLTERARAMQTLIEQTPTVLREDIVAEFEPFCAAVAFAEKVLMWEK